MRLFRGSITRLGARCLRFVPSLPSTKQDSLTAGGLPLPSPSSRSGFPPNGFTYRLPSIRSPFHVLRLAQSRSDPGSPDASRAFTTGSLTTTSRSDRRVNHDGVGCGTTVRKPQTLITPMEMRRDTNGFLAPNFEDSWEWGDRAARQGPPRTR